MFPNNTINQDHRIQFLNLRFNFSPQEEGELPVHVTCLGDNTQYFTRFAHNYHLTFNQIRARLREGHFTILTKNQEIFKISIQEVQAEFVSMSKLEINELKDTNDQIIEEIKQMLETQEIRIANKIRDEIQKLQINQIKNGVNECVRRQQQFQMIFQSQNDEVKDLKNSLQKYKWQIKKAVQQIRKINEESFKNQFKKLQNQIRSFENHNKRSVGTIKHCYDKIKKQQNQMKPNLNYFSNYFEKQLNVNLFKWSQQLKSKDIRIIGNIVTKTNHNNGYHQFCLLNASFSNTIKSKQLWAIKIKNNKGGIDLGVCLKSNMINCDFNQKNIKLSQTGHGLYMIRSNGLCYSHLQKDFNYVSKGFVFDDGDVIYVEYDPINNKLRFFKNKVDYFEMPIIAPPQNDAYHPFVSFRGQNPSVELIQPTRINKLH